ncbi:protein NO VEIN domain-containing protein [Pseudaeromonas pectinilytica]
MKTLTTDELAHELAGGDSYIRTKNNVVKGLAVTTEKNPEAPEIIIVGAGDRIIANAKLFLEQQQYVPVYVKQAVSSWKYLGSYKADRYSQDPEVIEKHRKHRPLGSIDGILFLSSSDELIVNVSAPSFPDAETRKKIELAAVQYVTTYYEEMGYSITDRQKDNCGYDLLAENSDETLKIEVKGTSAAENRFFISRNERSKSADPLWRLAIVTSALTNPSLEIFNSSEMERIFNFDALCWECTVGKT